MVTEACFRWARRWLQAKHFQRKMAKLEQRLQTEQQALRARHRQFAKAAEAVHADAAHADTARVSQARCRGGGGSVLRVWGSLWLGM